MAGSKLDTRAIGLDVGLSFAKWLTGAENLHYGDWTGLEVNAANFGPAQVAYTDRLFRFLPDKPCRILDIGGGAGETARKLLALGHKVEIVIPSAFLAGRCRENAKGAVVHEMRFEDFEGEDWGKWKAKGTAFGNNPVQGTTRTEQKISGYKGKRVANSYSAQGDHPVGKLTAEPFKIERRFINFLIGGGNHNPGKRHGQKFLINQPITRIFNQISPRNSLSPTDAGNQTKHNTQQH